MYAIIKYACSKNLQQGYVSPSDFMNCINMAQRSYEDYLLGEYQQYQLNRPIAVVEIGQNQRIRDSLAALIYGTVLPINQTTGISPFPSDYEYVDAMWSLYGIYNIKFIQQDRKDSYAHSDIDPIAQNPVYLIQHEGFEFLPVNPYGYTSARMSYVRNAPAIIWGYNEVNGVPVWNPATSQNPVWSETDCLQVIVRALAIIGVSLQFNTVLQYSNDIKRNGQ